MGREMGGGGRRTRVPAAAAAAVALALTVAGCRDGGAPDASPSPSPSAISPMPTTTAELLTRLDAIAERLETPGEDISARQRRDEACVELTRVRDHVERHPEPLLHDKVQLQLDLGTELCAQEAARAANRLRLVISAAPQTPVGATPE